ncbi:ankyrin repeat domain-containing protein, partial [bacterium]|nr:ankyrin repeat domain-containing protein [bacterium]
FSIGFGESQTTGNWVKKEKMVHLNIKNGGESIKFKFEKNELIMLDQIADLKLIKEGSKKIKDDYSKLDFTETLTINSAVILGDLAKVKLAVESGLDPNTPVGGTSNEMPMLNWASMGKNTELIKYLIDKGADVNSKNKDGLTPLMFAGTKGRVENALLLIENGADLFAKNSIKATCAHFLSICLMPDFLNLLVEKGVDFNGKDNRGRIPLMVAASSNLPTRNESVGNNVELHEAIKILIKQTTNINDTDNQGRTALHQAYDVLFAELLVEQGANINIKDNEGLTPLDTASLEKPFSGKNTRLIEFLKSNAAKSGGDDSFEVAIKVWNTEALEKHIDNGANPNHFSEDEYTLLDIHYLKKRKSKLEGQFGMLGMGGIELDQANKQSENGGKLVEKIISKGGTNTLQGAIGVRDANLIKELVANKKINPNQKKKNGVPVVFDLFSDISNPLSGLMNMGNTMGWKKEDFESLNTLLDNNLDVNLTIREPMMMQSKTILDCLEQELEMSGMLSMPGMPDSASLEKQFKELIRKVKSKGGTNVVLTNQWSDEFDPNEYENSTYSDSDGDGVDDYDESLLGLDGKPIGDKDDPSITPTSAQINAGTPP